MLRNSPSLPQRSWQVSHDKCSHRSKAEKPFSRSKISNIIFSNSLALTWECCVGSFVKHDRKCKKTGRHGRAQPLAVVVSVNFSSHGFWQKGLPLDSISHKDSRHSLSLKFRPLYTPNLFIKVQNSWLKYCDTCVLAGRCLPFFTFILVYWKE